VSFELIRILYLYATLTIIFMNPAIELLFGIVASLSGRQASHICTFVFYADASPAITSTMLWPPACQ